jgi:hypothetical protein
MTHYSVYLGTVGWMHAQWEGVFYPQDLPEDWQLPFYSTQFRCVYLPYELWRNASGEDVAGWLNDTKESFRFVLQLPEGTEKEDRLLARRFGERGISDRQINLVWLEGKPDLRNLAQRMQKAAQNGSPLYLISRTEELTQLRQIGELMEVLGV